MCWTGLCVFYLPQRPFSSISAKIRAFCGILGHATAHSWHPANVPRKSRDQMETLRATIFHNTSIY